jgi:glycosyltransferase involved in cell wall biosynthesis
MAATPTVDPPDAAAWDTPDVSVLVCTWNRVRTLERTLLALGDLDVPSGLRWELVLVDNGSTDATERVATEAARRLPLRYLQEPRQGLSHARNAGLSVARGRLLLWTDDDVIPASRWLAAHAEAAANHAEAAFLGGPIRPLFEMPPPRWLESNLATFGTAFAMRDLGPDDRWITEPQEVPFGANMAVRRDALAELRFDPALGRRGESLLSGEETAIFRRLLAQGARGRWVAAAEVRHAIPAERMSERYLADYFYWVGRTAARHRLVAGERPDRKRFMRRLREARRRQRWRLYRDQGWAEAFRAAATARGWLDALADHAGTGSASAAAAASLPEAGVR